MTRIMSGQAKKEVEEEEPLSEKARLEDDLELNEEDLDRLPI